MPIKAPTPDGQTNGGDEGNAENGQQAAQTPAPSATPTELVIKYNSKEIAIPIERARELAQKGMSFEEKMTQLNQRGRNIESFDRFMADRAANPLLDEAVKLAISNPGLVLQAIKPQAGAPANQQAASDGGDEQEPAAAQRGNEDLARQVQELSGAVQALLGKDSSREVQTALDREISKHPWVAGHASAERVVRDYVNTRIAAGARDTVDQLVFEAASSVKDVIAEQDAKRLEQSEARKNLRTANNSRGTVVVTPAPKLTAKSLTDGTLLQAALQRGKEVLGW